MLDVNTLRKGDTLRYVDAAGKCHTVQVQTDPEPFGSYNERTVTIGYGPGRWNRSVSNQGQRVAYYTLERVES